MLYGANSTVCSKINAEHINTMWQNVKFLIIIPVGVLHNQ
jgi:hypothetical protein